MSFKTCPSCNEQRPHYEVFCQSDAHDDTCGWDLTDVPLDLPRPEAPPSAPPNAGPVCVKGHPLNPGDFICGVCGSDIASGVFLDQPSQQGEFGEEEQLEYQPPFATQVGGWELLGRLDSPGTSIEAYRVRDADGAQGILTLYPCGVRPDAGVDTAVDSLAPHIAAQGWRVIATDMRGRGQSEYAAQSASYIVPTYVADVFALLAQEKVERFVAIGTSMGGLMTMGIATIAPEKIAGAALNDIGPQLELEGIDKIKTYVGQGRSFPTWMHAARELEAVHGGSHPRFGTEDWLAMAKRTLTLCSNGRIAFDYDMKIAEPLHAAAGSPPVDLWPAFRALAGRPVLAIRGELSDLLSAATLERMAAELPGLDVCLVPRTGHPPTLEEPAALAAIGRLLAKVA